MERQKFVPVIGLEIHLELKTQSKMFCGCSTNYFGTEPNTHCCPVCLGLPGALPVPNEKAVEWCLFLGLALGCRIPLSSHFDRKNYFYPDLPKGYQISQYDKPFAVDGSLKIKSPEEKIIRIRRVHMEEDTGKLLHARVNGKNCTLIDFNRSGVPLVEIVTEPDIRSSEEARVFLKKLHKIIRYLGISDADMEKGSMRLEPNISVRPMSLRASAKQSIKIATSSSTPRNDSDTDLPKYKVEVKNINSFSFVKKAIDYEIARQTEILLQKRIPVQETRGWDEKKGITYSQRSKEEAHDYRYFPEPDIPPVSWTGAQILKIKSQIGELPGEKSERIKDQYGLSEYDAKLLTETKETAEYFEKAVKYNFSLGKNKEITPKTIANWIINKKVDLDKTSPEELIKQMAQKAQRTIVSDEELEKTLKKVLAANAKAVADYRKGKDQAMMFLVGQVMREIKGQALVGKIKEKIISLLNRS